MNSTRCLLKRKGGDLLAGFAGLWILFTCNGQTAGTGQSPPILADGFEQDRVASFWLPGNYGSGLYVPGAIRTSTNYARSGQRSVEITDVAAPGDGDTHGGAG